MLNITHVQPRSPAARAGVTAGMMLTAVDGRPVADILDYRFYTSETAVRLTLSGPGGERTVKIRNPGYDDLGLTFEEDLPGRQSCSNNCVFCFIAQNPSGLRPEIYYRDDDIRLSFLQGNYITLTNLTARDIERIKAMRISPVNISVHATQPGLRADMMGNPAAADGYAIMRDLASAGICFNCQIVVCPGYNDGEELRRTLCDLLALYPNVESVSVVPVGITCHRRNLPPLRPVGAEDATRILELCGELGGMMLESYGRRIVYAADELYLMAGRGIPPPEHYAADGYPQLENGVGMMALLRDEVMAELAELADTGAVPADYEPPGIITGVAAAAFMREMAQHVAAHTNRVAAAVYAIPNRLFGETVDVAGLVSGGDIAAGLTGRPLPRRLLFPRTMLRSQGDMFLDNMTPGELSRILGAECLPVEIDGAALVRAILNTSE